MKSHRFLLIVLALIFVAKLSAQGTTQTVRGMIVDRESQQPLIGANIVVEKTIPMIGASTDAGGKFIIENVPVGRHNFAVSYLGYEPLMLSNIQVVSGKETFLNIELVESTVKLDELVIEAHHEPAEAMNDMAIVSARGFSVEETGRYAGSFFDPARMAKNFAGVSVAGGSSDLFNEIIVRGNSPRGVLWRLEGIEIPNPNHFGELGNTGGGISMLSSSTLANSDFYTGAFPAEFGNATSGVFDLNLRKGNSHEREYAFMAGVLGIEAAMEGPFSKHSDASYLVNVRYSTLSILESIGLSPVSDALPEYGDISFNINLPSKRAGQFNIFGLGGANRAYFQPEADSTKWEYSGDNEGYNDKQKSGTIGLVHKYLINDNSYIKTVAAYSLEIYDGEGYYLDGENNYNKVVEYTDKFNNYTFRINSTYTLKLNAANTFKAGVIYSYSKFDFFTRELEEDEDELVTYLSDNGTANQYQAFGQWKYRFHQDWTLTGGVHMNYFALNGTWSVEPRLAAKWEVNERMSITGAAGLHSKPEHPSFYYSGSPASTDPDASPNFDLDYTKSVHTVLGFNMRLFSDLRIGAEAYFQYLYDVPVQSDLDKTGSMINVREIWDFVYAGPGVNGGNGRNYGIDITIEKNYSRKYYLLFTGSLFNSEYSTLAGEWYNTRFSSKYQVNFLGGKEWNVGKTGDNVFGANIKAVFNGGERTTPINLAQSMIEGHTVRYPDRVYAESLGAYYRIDMGVSYKINRPKVTHTLTLDIQNVTNHLNRFQDYYDPELGAIDYDYHTGLFPVLNYRIEF